MFASPDFPSTFQYRYHSSSRANIEFRTGSGVVMLSSICVNVGYGNGGQPREMVIITTMEHNMELTQSFRSTSHRPPSRWMVVHENHEHIKMSNKSYMLKRRAWGSTCATVGGLGKLKCVGNVAHIMLCMGIAIEILGYCNRNTIQAEGSDIN